MDVDGLRIELQIHGQSHLLDHWEGLNGDEKKCLYNDLRAINFAEVNKFFKQCSDDMGHSGKKVDDFLQPLPQEMAGSTTRADDETLKRYETEGKTDSVPLSSRKKSIALEVSKFLCKNWSAWDRISDFIW